MLDTVLEIGRILRSSPDGLKHHRYIKKAPEPDEKAPIRFWRVPVEDDGSFDFAHRVEMNDEVAQKRCLYLNYKSSDADSSKPFIFGDLYRSVLKDVEDGNFRFGDPTKKSWSAKNSFQRAEGLDIVATDRAMLFRSSFRAQEGLIEQHLRSFDRCYLHFDFCGLPWFELTEEMDGLNESLLGTFFAKSKQGYLPASFLYKSLASSASKLPGFLAGSEHRARVFRDREQALDLLYGVNYASKHAVRKGDVKVVILPRGSGLSAATIERFFGADPESEPGAKVGEREQQVRAELSSVAAANSSSQSAEVDEIFGLLMTVEPALNEIAEFDFVFSKAGGTKPDIDMIEIAGLERSKLAQISRRISTKRREIEHQLGTALASTGRNLSKWPILITNSFELIMGDSTRAKKKYQSHLFRVLPQIYSGSYYDDPVLLPAIIEKVEFGVRSDAIRFTNLQVAFYFLLKIQDYRGDRLMEIQESASYRIGALLGKMARPFAGQSSPIKSFEKNYVGLLSRRIGTIADVVKLANDISQKLVMHDMLFTNVREAANELAATVKTFSGRYDRNHCAFGFFESYFAPFTRKGDDESSAAGSQTSLGADAAQSGPA